MAASLDINALLGVISNQQTSRALLFSSLAILVYDHTLVLPLEVVKIWKAQWTPVKFCYIANRIINWLVVILSFINAYGVSLSNSYCRSSAAVMVVLSTSALTINQWVLLLRVDACYQRKATKIITAWFAVTAILGVAVSAILMRDLVEHLVFVPVVRCVPTQPITIWSNFMNVPYLLFETTMFTAMVWNYMRSPGRDFAGGNVLLYAIFHNAAIYFLAILWIGFITILMSNVGPPAARANVVVLTASMSTSALSRSILDLRSLSTRFGDSSEKSEDISLPRRVTLPTRVSGYGQP